MVPSSPRGPCSMISTTSSRWRSPGGRLSEDSMRCSAAVPAASVARPASACFTEASAPPSPRAWRAASSASARMGSPPTSQRPSRVMPMGTGLKRSRSMAERTEAALARETSCSPDSPPKITPTRSFFAMLFYSKPAADWACSPSAGSPLALLLPPAVPRGEACRELFLEPAVHRTVVDPAAQGLGQMLLGDAGIHGVVGVLIALAVAHVRHEARGGVAEVQRHRLGRLVLDIPPHLVPRCVHGVRLRGEGEIAGRLGEGQLALGGA